jgi:CheY-like chemotaxis protein
MDQLADTDARHDGHRVLVVDDNRSVREPLVTLLEGRGFSARGAGNGREALQILRDGFNACLILLDLTMPIMDGWTFRTVQRGEPKLAEIPIVVLTALTDPKKAAEELGAIAGFAKPLDLEHLVRLVAEHCPRTLPQSRVASGAADRAAQLLRPRRA